MREGSLQHRLTSFVCPFLSLPQDANPKVYRHRSNHVNTNYTRFNCAPARSFRNSRDLTRDPASGGHEDIFKRCIANVCGTEPSGSGHHPASVVHDVCFRWRE